MGKNNNNSSITMDQLLASINKGTQVTKAAQQVNSEQLAEVAKAQESYYEAFQKRFDTHEDNMSKGMFHLNETINQGTAATIDELRSAESRLTKEIKKSRKSNPFTWVDWLTSLIVSIVFGAIGWVYSNCMIARQFAAWVDRQDTIQYIRDGSGNITDITNTTSAVTVMPTVYVTIGLFAIIGFALAFIVLSVIKEKEGD